VYLLTTKTLIMKNLRKHIRSLCLSVPFLLFNNAVAQQTCLGSLEFDAANTAVELPQTNQYYTATNDGFTWECYFKLNAPLSSTPKPLISAVDAVTYDDLYLGFGWTGGVFNAPGNTLIFRVDPGSGGTPVDPNCSYVPSLGFAVGRWYHAAGVIDYKAKKKYLYVDGVLVDTKPATGAPHTRIIQTNLSACTACSAINTLDGRIDEVRMWTKPRSATDISGDWTNCLWGNELNLLLYYRCNQVGALTVLDATANSNHGDFLNINPSWSTDNAPVAGPACDWACDCLGSLNFDASNDAVELPPNNQYYSGNGYTWETWFKLNQPIGTIDKPLISGVDWTVYEDMYLGFGWHGGVYNTGYDTLNFRVEGPGSMFPANPSCKYSPPGGFVIGQWYHVAAVADYINLQKHLYVNGILVDSKPLTVPPNTRVIQVNLSACDGCTNYNSNYCKMDEVRIWTTALTGANILANYQTCRTGSEPNLLVYYRCNQPTAPTVFDGTGLGNTGIFRTNMGWSVENAPVSGAVCRADCNRGSHNPPDGKTTGIEKPGSPDAGLKLYPNPSSGSIKVSAAQPGVLTVYSVTGQLLSEIKVQKAEQEVKLQGFKAGIYLYVFTSGSSTSSGKLIIE
jgi:hypothetical protein